MSSVLATNMTNSMHSRAGFLSLNELMDESTMYYTFKDCIKYKKDTFHSWLCYWEGSPIAVLMSVKASVLSNGFTKIAILSKEIKDITEVGAYPSKRSLCNGNILNGKFYTEKGLSTYVVDTIASGNGDEIIHPVQVQKSAEKKVLSQAEIDHFKQVMAENWGCTLK